MTPTRDIPSTDRPGASGEGWSVPGVADGMLLGSVLVLGVALGLGAFLGLSSESAQQTAGPGIAAEGTGTARLAQAAPIPEVPGPDLPVPIPLEEGRIVVFEHEATTVKSFDDSEGCRNMPAAAHVAVNLTDQQVVFYSDPGCNVPAFTLQPGFGSHAAPGQGFSVGDTSGTAPLPGLPAAVQR